MPKSFHLIRPARDRRRGVALIFALLTLTVLLIAALALVRTIDTGSLILGNIGFKNDATFAADQATRRAIAWLNSNTAALSSDLATAGYYATNRQDDASGTTLLGPLDLTGRQLPGAANRQLVNWDNDGCASAGSFGSCTLASADAGTINGNAARYVIFRQCAKTGDYSTDSTIVCSKPVASSNAGSSKKGEINYTDAVRLDSGTAPYYRIVVRVKGARNTVSYTETLVHF
jgi:Tfp pilus assembly protein PilX